LQGGSSPPASFSFILERVLMIVLDIDGVVSNTYEYVPLGQVEGYAPDSLAIKNSKPFEDAWYWVNHYSSIYDIMFVTDRDKSLTNITWEWFREWDIPVDFIVFEKDATDFLSQMNPTVYVDDSADSVAAAKIARVNSFLINRPYNTNNLIEHSLKINTLWDIECV
jgi:uncharacterized HAD superfamily protein